MGGLGLSGGGVCRGRCALSGGGFFAVFIFRLTDAENEFAEKLFKILRRLRELDVAVFRQGRFVRAGLQREVAATERAFVLAVAGFFLVFSYKTGDVGAVNGYTLSADFPGIGGLKAGDDVTISGVKVGSVTSVDLLPDNFLARVYMDIDSGIKLPTDTAALISSESLLGGRYLAPSPPSADRWNHLP